MTVEKRHCLKGALISLSTLVHIHIAHIFLKEVRRSCKFDPIKYDDISEDDKYIESKNVQMVNITEKDYRMRFGKPLIFDNSGENLTRGISMQLRSSI